MTPLDCVVVGAGHAGLAIASCLREQGRDFVVLERGRIGETWRSQRWDSFQVNTPNWMNLLPGQELGGAPRDGFFRRDELVRGFERYAEEHALPVTTGVAVTMVGHVDAAGTFVVSGTASGGGPVSWKARSVVVASGMQREPRPPGFGRELPPGMAQLHSAQYRAPEFLPPGAVVVVGSAQSGCQIAENLLAAGRTVYLCASRVARVPRRHRGRDITEWWLDAGFWDQTVADLEDPAMRLAPQPQVSGVGRRGHTVSLQQLARDGALLLGRALGVNEGRLELDSRLGAYVRFADERSAKMKQDIDAAILRAAGTLAADEDDPADVPAPELYDVSGPAELDLRAAGVGAIIWCTGFTAEFGWLRLPVLDARGAPVHEGGVSPVPGLYFLGFPWLRKRKSGIIFGIAEDAARIAEAVKQHLPPAPPSR
jgi:putative flavoprotein involved in K+ transport